MTVAALVAARPAGRIDTRIAAGTLAPIAGLGGEDTAVPMALLMIAGAALSMVGLLVPAHPAAPSAPVEKEISTCVV